MFVTFADLNLLILLLFYSRYFRFQIFYFCYCLGHSVPMPDGYKALVMQTESGDRLSERSELKSRLVKTLSQMTVWNYDASGDNHITKALQWTQLAELMHSEDHSE